MPKPWRSRWRGGANKFLDRVIGAQAGHLGGDVDGVVEVPQVINQTHLLGLAAGEDAAVGKLQDLFLVMPSLGHHGPNCWKMSSTMAWKISRSSSVRERAEEPMSLWGPLVKVS